MSANHALPTRAVPPSIVLADCDIANDRDPQVRQAFRRALRLMERGIAVLIQGETGTGKEVLARALHLHNQQTRRANLVSLNCASIPETLIESELFGYARGAFSGALPGGKKGKVLQADGGTLFLDEIGDMPYEQQTRLLRVIAEREITPLGAEQSIPVDFALICATHQDLSARIKAGEFREDLFYRIATGVVHLPALRERTDRADLICSMVAAEMPERDPRQAIADDVWGVLMNHPWPGNLRQMRAVIRYACAVMEGSRIQRHDLPEEFAGAAALQPAPEIRTGTAPYSAPNTRPLATGFANVTPLRQRVPVDMRVDKSAEERHNVLQVLKLCRWNMTAAARELGICRPSLYRILRRLEIAPLRSQLAEGEGLLC
ncbi:sigma 54-interacting transcriptional regulator [Pseudomonas sp. MWU16-30317]|uniref:sigma-54-dependent Fis family transcriptional regulator n=1 Tax=Pseudomonas sp. MWU16-30317 TaxID=2878095 RepID=UPI0021AD9715|nr:sigma 54-interacting transcriptional regulator [Pseudomonas sp. MWU16-30317]